MSTFENPQSLRYSKEHEWLTAVDADGIATVGITAFAADALGDVVYVQLPEVGATVAAGDACGELESTKSVSDLYSPVGGEIVEVNSALEANPELVGTGAFGDGWIFRIRVAEVPDDLLSADEYGALTGA